MHTANMYWLISEKKDVKPFYHLSPDIINDAYIFWSTSAPRRPLKKDWCWAAVCCKGVIDREIIRGASGRCDETDLVEEFSVEERNVNTYKIL
jgi:hypothetical protein